MKNYKNELSKGIYLEDYHILVEWETNQNDLFEKLSKVDSFRIEENAEFKVVRYCVQSKILGNTEKFIVGFNFVKGKLTSISLVRETLDLSIEEYFAQMQCFLESKFGKPKRVSNLFANIFKEQNDTVYKWSLNHNVAIVHSLFDFDSRTTLEIIV